jgi:hypothetical protein
MAFARKLASVGTFGLAGLAINALTKKKNNNDKPNPSLMTSVPPPPPGSTPSLMNSNTAY